MKRKDFLKGIAGIAASLGIVGVDLSEDQKTMLLDLKARVSRGHTAWNEGDVTELEWEQRVPTDLNPEAWAELGITEEQLHRFAMQYYIINCQMAARATFRATEDADAAIEAAKNWSPRSRRRKL